MRALLTSAGIKNRSIHDALGDLLGKPIAESNALFIPTAIYPFPGGPGMAWRAISGKSSSPLSELGWKSLGILELTALPSIEEAAWVPTVRDADALLVWGGDPLFLATWMRRSGLTALLPTLRAEAVYVGVSAGSIAATSTFVETYTEPPRWHDGPLTSEHIVFATPQGDVDRILVTGQGAGLVDFAVIPHFEHADHPDASVANAERWAARIPAPTYAIDDQTAVRVVDGAAEVVSEGNWKLFEPPAVTDHRSRDTGYPRSR
ncbi:MAG: Type 1 glutamine amidotransferase-like domain-containing protein [Chloroflexota bacterium]|nr:Type 1 glutamine amidotransferase-like domain-containing protein [Chloroflexota bacterium]